jgi:hypothetical protein
MHACEMRIYLLELAHDDVVRVEQRVHVLVVALIVVGIQRVLLVHLLVVFIPPVADAIRDAA